MPTKTRKPTKICPKPSKTRGLPTSQHASWSDATPPKPAEFQQTRTPPRGGPVSVR